jgi:hypothetical protein
MLSFAIPGGISMRAAKTAINVDGLRAATKAVGEQLRAEAQAQGAYVQLFDDGKVSLELEWIDPAELARAALQAYLRHAPAAHVGRKSRP